jgi:hypothetical protein
LGTQTWNPHTFNSMSSSRLLTPSNNNNSLIHLQYTKVLKPYEINIFLMQTKVLDQTIHAPKSVGTLSSSIQLHSSNDFIPLLLTVVERK